MQKTVDNSPGRPGFPSGNRLDINDFCFRRTTTIKGIKEGAAVKYCIKQPRALVPFSIFAI